MEMFTYTSYLFVSFLAVVVKVRCTGIAVPSCCDMCTVSIVTPTFVFNASDSIADSIVCPIIEGAMDSQTFALAAGPSPLRPLLNGDFTIQGETDLFIFQFQTCSGDHDVLVIKPDSSYQDQRGTLEIQYTPEGMSPVNISFVYSPRGIFFNGDASVSQVITAPTTVDFELRDDQLATISVCEVTPSGQISTSSLLRIISTPPNTSCSPFTINGNKLVTAYVVPVRLVGTPSSSTTQIFLSLGTCGVQNVIRSSTINVTIQTDVDPPETTTPEMNVTTGLPTEGPGEDAYIIPVAATVGVVTLLIVVVVIVLCCLKRRTKPAPTDLDRPEANGMRLTSPDEIKEGDEDAGERLREPNNIEAVSRCVTIAPAPAPTKQAPPVYTVSGVAFVTAGDSSNYKQLEKEILPHHQCDRVQPVATFKSSQSCTLDDYCRGISRLLREGKSLVYVIWSGSLESVNGSHNPPIKKLVQYLTQRHLQRDPSNSISVMHRLILVQLGSKGTVDHIASESDATFVFWSMAAEEDGFDAEKCGAHVCKVAKDRLRLMKHKNKTRVATKKSDPKAKLKVSDHRTGSADNVTFFISSSPHGSHTGLSDPDPDTQMKKYPTPEKQDSQPRTDDHLEKKFEQFTEKIFHKIDTNHRETLEHVDTVVDQVDHVARRVEENDLTN